MKRQHNFIDLTGKRFGSWTVIGLESANGWRLRWRCACDCGNERIMRGDGLKRAGENGYCNECKPKNAVIDISSLSADEQDRIRDRSDGLYKNTFITDGETAYGYTSDGRAYVLDAKNVEKASHYCWIVKGRGYVTALVKNKERYLHNYLLENYETGMYVDHINLDKLDNRETNFRVCSLQQNAFNQGKPRTNTSGIKGVRKLADGTWHAVICFCQTGIHLGNYSTADEAGAAYDFAAKVLFGSFSWSNAENGFISTQQPSDDTIHRVLKILNRIVMPLTWWDEAVLHKAKLRINELVAQYGVDTIDREPVQRSRDGRGRSGYKGVHANPKGDNWVVRIAFNGKLLVGGVYDKANEAAAAYDYAIELLHGKGKRLWLNRDHRDDVAEATESVIRSILRSLEKALSIEKGWRDYLILQKSRNRLSEKIASFTKTQQRTNEMASDSTDAFSLPFIERGATYGAICVGA